MDPSFEDVLLSDRTRAQAQAFLTRPAHALLISGQPGSGKIKLARSIASHLLCVPAEELDYHPHIIFVSRPDNKSEIPIEAIRELIKKMSLRVAISEDSVINRVAIIDSAQYLSAEAQNALLKLLEEPPKKSLIILTVGSENSILPTVASRTQKINITPASLVQAAGYFNNYPQPEVESAYRLSRGAGSLLEALLSMKEDHSLKIAVNQAKDYIAADKYSRLIQIESISKDKPAFIIFLDAIMRILSLLTEENIKRNKAAATARILATRKAVDLASSQVQNNANIRLIALSLVQNTKI